MSVQTDLSVTQGYFLMNLAVNGLNWWLMAVMCIIGVVIPGLSPCAVDL